ncbi:hypothetical protein N2152v2_005934 [Parachlorella kessleri]
MSVAGIDVGDSASCIALARRGGVDVLLNRESKRESPSLVTFTAKQRMIGSDAASSLSTNPKNTVSWLKRLMGKRYSDPVVQEDMPDLPYKVVEGPQGECLFEVQYLGQPTRLTAEQLMAAMLVDLKKIAETEQGEEVKECVISVPTFYTEPERHAMLDAAQIAGWNCLRLLNDTAATALAYGIYKTDLPEKDPINVVFVDVGHAATQVCVVALKKGQLQVLSNAWDRDLGGRDFDKVLFEHFVNEFNTKYKLDVKSQLRARFRLRLACEKLKKILSANSEAPINVESLQNDVDASGMMTRDVFEEMSKPVLDRLLVPVQKAVEAAGLTPEQVSAVELVGGSSRIPALQRILTTYFGREPSRTLNAKETVSRGCALQAAMLSPSFKVRDFQVVDSFPYGVAFSWPAAEKDQPPVTSTVFEKGSHVPSAKMLTFYRSEPFSITAQYTDDSDIPSTASKHIGSFHIGAFKVPAGTDKAKLKVKVTLNLNGVVNVEQVQLLEEEEYQEEVPLAAAGAAPAPADQPMEDAAAAADEKKPTEDGEAATAAEASVLCGRRRAFASAADAPMEEAAAPAAAAAVAPAPAATQKVTKKRVKKHSVPFTSETAAMSREQLQAFYEQEGEMALQARVQEETSDRKNALESYIYSLRNRLSEQLAAYVGDDAKAGLLAKLEDMENWLYDEGEDVAKSVYVAKLEELKKLGAPVEQRFAEDAARPAAVAALRAAAQRYLAAARSGEAKYAHIEQAEKDRVVQECEAALRWLDEKEALQKSLRKTDDPVLLSADVAKKQDTVARVCEPILSKPPPPAPKKEEPAVEEPKEGDAAAMETDAADEAEIGPQPAPEGGEPMQEE